DVVDIALIDQKGGWVYFHASPDDGTRLSLYRTKLDGSGSPTRLTPPAMSGTNRYELAPSGEWAFVTHSKFDVPPQTSLVRLPIHTTTRVLGSNDAAKTNLTALSRGKVEFTRLDIGGAVL